MTFTLRQSGLAATGVTSGGTTYLAEELPGLSVAGSLLVATMQTAHGGTPFTCVSLATPPGGVAASAVGSGGTFGAGTYFYKLTVLAGGGETVASAEVSATVVANGSVSLTWSALPSFVTGVKVYRGTSSNNETTLVATLGAVTAYTDTGSGGATASPPQVPTANVPNTSPGWEYCGLAFQGTVLQAEVWAYRNNPGGLSGATFANTAGQACRGTIQEWTTTRRWQSVELFPTGAGGTTGNPAVTLGNAVGSGDLVIALLAEHLTAGLTGQTWTTPSGWTLVQSQANSLGTPWASYYQVTTGAGAPSITGNYSGTGTGQDGKAAVMVVFKESDSVAGRVGVGGINANTYTDQASFGFPATHVGSCQEFDNFVGRKMALSAMVGFQTTEGGTVSSVPGDVADMVAQGAQIHYALKPQRALTGSAAIATEQGKVATCLTTFKQAGINCFSVSFWNEFNYGGQNGPFGNDTTKQGSDPYGTGWTEPGAKANWLAYWAMWQPICALHGIPAFTKPASASPKAAVTWQPPAGTLSGIIQDFYMSDSDGKSFYLDSTGVAGVPSLQDVCDGVRNPDNTVPSPANAPILLGLGELGRAGGASTSLTWAQVVAWSHTSGRTGHVRDFFYNRLQAGKQNGIVCWFENNLGGPNWIHTPGNGGEDQAGIQAELGHLVDDLTVAAVTGGNPVITTTSPLPGGQVGVPYSAFLQASGGTTPYAYSVTTSQLPAGLSLDPATGEIAGSPTTAQALSVGFTVTDHAGLTGVATLSITIAGSQLDVPAQTLPPATTGQAYAGSIIVTGGTPPDTLAITAGSLPAGLALSGSSVVGTPTGSPGVSTFTVQATDHVGATASRQLSITVAAPAFGITTTVVPPGEVGQPYVAEVDAAGGTGPVTWTLVSGTLPPGLSIAAAAPANPVITDEAGSPITDEAGSAITDETGP